jgi:hypothetical protein
MLPILYTVIGLPLAFAALPFKRSIVMTLLINYLNNCVLYSFLAMLSLGCIYFAEYLTTIYESVSVIPLLLCGYAITTSPFVAVLKSTRDGDLPSEIVASSALSMLITSYLTFSVQYYLGTLEYALTIGVVFVLSFSLLITIASHFANKEYERG